MGGSASEGLFPDEEGEDEVPKQNEPEDDSVEERVIKYFDVSSEGLREKPVHDDDENDCVDPIVDERDEGGRDCKLVEKDKEKLEIRGLQLRRWLLG